VESSYFGMHQISGVKLSSPAQQSGHLERGDEILQVNYQTVVCYQVFSGPFYFFFKSCCRAVTLFIIYRLVGLSLM